ncbi:MAG TPA: glutamate synthase [Firmicutes bacterium]|nr:glutamate synthase [Bacillota bacterium]
MNIDVSSLDFKTLNEALRASGDEVTIDGCLGQRFIAAGMAKKKLTINGVPGNALGAYLNGASVTVNANAQDAVGDTMNDGEIIIHGNVGDAVGYAMRGGKIIVEGNAGYRAGIHMKEYKEKIPEIIIGGTAGSFLGEYQAGGVIVVLGLGSGDKPIVGSFPCTGMHGGHMYLRGDCAGIEFPSQVSARPAGAEDMEKIKRYVIEYCNVFDSNADEILASPFTVVTPDSKNPYKQMYVAN